MTTIQEIARRAAEDEQARQLAVNEDRNPLNDLADAVAVAVLQEVKREIAMILANTTTMETGWRENDYRWRSAFAELRMRVQVVSAMIGSGTKAAPQVSDTPRRSEAHK